MSRIVSGYRRYLLLLCWLACLGPAAAQTGESVDYDDFPPAPLRPDQLLRQGIDRLTHFLSTERDLTPTQIRAFLEREIAPYFDFAYMARWAAGSFHRRLTEEQRIKLGHHLSELFLSALARNLGSYTRPIPRIDISPAVRGRTKNEVAVFARVGIAQGLIIKLEFRFYWSPHGWRIFDVAANGASAVGYYRRYYTEQLRRHGPDTLLN